MKICAVVVTYYPDVEDAKKNIMQYLPWIDHLIIWENTPQKYKYKYKIDLIDYSDRISYMGLGKNIGISAALNRAIGFAYKNGYSHLLTMDQDSKWESFKIYKEYVIQNCSSSIAVPLINNEIYSYGDKPSMYLITSGMLIPIDILKRIGGYWEEFMIDGIDTELCFRARNAGIDIKKIPVGKLNQILGTPSKVNILGYKYISLGYSPFRLYGIARSMGIIMRKYNTPFDFKKSFLCYPVKTSFNILFSNENQKIRKILSIWKGIWCGLTCKMSNLKVLSYDL